MLPSPHWWTSINDGESPPAARVAAARELLDRAHGRPSASMKLPMPAGTLAEQGQAALNAAASGKLPLGHLNSLMTALAQQAKLVEVSELDERLEAIEAALKVQ